MLPQAKNHKQINDPHPPTTTRIPPLRDRCALGGAIDSPDDRMFTFAPLFHMLLREVFDEEFENAL